MSRAKAPNGLPLVELAPSDLPDGCAKSLMKAFWDKALMQNWPHLEIVKVIQDAEKGDYNHTVQIIMEYTTL